MSAVGNVSCIIDARVLGYVDVVLEMRSRRGYPFWNHRRRALGRFEMDEDEKECRIYLLIVVAVDQEDLHG